VYLRPSCAHAAYREQFYPESVIPETLKVWRVFDQTFNIT